MRGALTGNGARHEPKAEQTEKYREALRLYRETAMTHRQIAEATGITVTGLRNHLRIWNRKLIVEHRGYECREGEAVDLSRTKQYLKSTAAKYAGAIACLKETGRPTAEVAKEFGLHPETFREYVREHEPELAARLGMTRLAELADVIVPNLTEAAVLLGEDHSFGALTHDEAGYRSVVERLSRNGTRSVVLTGVMLHKGEIGACVFDRASGGTEFLFDTFIGKEFHGTGDVFASVLTGALVKGKTLHEAVRLAEAFVRECAIQTMPQNIPAREGVDFEPILWKLHEGL